MNLACSRSATRAGACRVDRRVAPLPIDPRNARDDQAPRAALGPSRRQQCRTRRVPRPDRRTGRYAMRRTQGWTEKKRSGERVERYEGPAEAGIVRYPLKPALDALPRRRAVEPEPAGPLNRTVVLLSTHHRGARRSPRPAAPEVPVGIRRLDSRLRATHLRRSLVR